MVKTSETTFTLTARAMKFGDEGAFEPMTLAGEPGTRGAAWVTVEDHPKLAMRNAYAIRANAQILGFEKFRGASHKVSIRLARAINKLRAK